jgi:cysteinyl-tRNA synthetase
VRRTLIALREVVTKMSKALGLFEAEPRAWLLARRARQVKARGIDVAKVEAAIAARQAARAAKNFQEADRIRAELQAQGVEIMDTPRGTEWKVASERAASA